MGRDCLCGTARPTRPPHPDTHTRGLCRAEKGTGSDPGGGPGSRLPAQLGRI